MTKEHIAIDIGSQTIKWLSLRMTSKGPFLTGFGIKEIPLHREQSPHIPLVETLKDLVKEAPFRLKRSRLTVHGEGFHLLRLTLPSMPKSELAEAIRWELKGKFSFPLETSHVDFYVIEEFTEEGVKKVDLMAIVCPVHLIDETLSIAREADLKPEHVTLVPLALWNAWERQKRGETDEGVVLIDVGAARTRICFLKKGLLQFYREVIPGGLDMTKAVAEGLDSGISSESLMEEAEEIKRTLGARIDLEEEGELVSASPSDGSETQEERWSGSQLRSASFRMRPLLEKLAGEIHRSIDYFQSHSGDTRVKEVLLSGGGARMKHLATFLEEELNLPVSILNPLSNIPFDPQGVQASRIHEWGPQFTVAFGSVLAPQVEIELLPRREPLGRFTHFRYRLTAFSILSVLVSLLTLTGLGWVFWKMDRETRSLQRELETRSKKTRELETLRARITLLKEKEAKLRGRLPFLPELSAPTTFHAELLQSIAEALPQNVTLTTISLTSKRQGQEGKSSSIPPSEKASRDRSEEALHLSGLAFGSDLECLAALSRIVEGLEENRVLKNVSLLSLEEDKSYNRPATQFEIACEVEPHFGHGRGLAKDAKKE